LKVDEKHIIKGIRAGRESAYALLFKKFYRPLSVFATTYINDQDSAKEIVQDLFVHLYENRRVLVISTSLKSYLYQSVRNRCLNHLKRTQVERKHLDQAALEQRSTEDLEAKIAETELEYGIFRVISELPPKCQKIFRMSRVHGFKNKEIAEELGISVRTVETQISNALKVLREKLGYTPSSS
jgi:RNA polymerase sigma-70 factor (ECF subfamily)